MFAVLFEVEPRPERWEEYLTHAAALRPELVQIDGFLENRRFRSLRHEGRLLSLSFWRDEKAVVRWRSHAQHHAVQARGRSAVFRDYHLRVGEVVSENGAPQPQQRFDETETGIARAVSVIECPSRDAPPTVQGLVDWDIFDGITDPDDRVLLLSWRDAAAMQSWTEQAGNRRCDVRIVRDYGLRDRVEAPQYHP
jgi:heme-degrading monooxygenase HmoA